VARGAMGDADVSSVHSGSQHSEGERRMFVAIYDYTPSKHSTANLPAPALPFKTGDVITTYGGVRPDGFYTGKVNGMKGLVPASFIEEVAHFGSQNKRSTLSHNTGSHYPRSSVMSSGSRGSESSSRPNSGRSILTSVSQQQAHRGGYKVSSPYV